MTDKINNPLRAVFLDRDGVINQSVIRNGKPYPPDNVEELVILPEVGTAITMLKEAGLFVFVVTNQPDVAKGIQKQEVVETINNTLSGLFPIDEIFTCYHDDVDNCDCRKPRPGLLLQAARKYGIDLAKSFLVGDRWKDIDAGYEVNCTTFFIDYGYREKKSPHIDYTICSLYEAAVKIVEIITLG